MNSQRELTQEYLKSRLHYNPETGVFTRLVAASKNIKVGNVAGWENGRGYIHIMVKRKTYKAHRLTFLYMTGSFPKHEVDHINRIKDDNRWSNLRECSKSQNRANCGPNKNNMSGFKGVTWNKRAKKWTSQIRFEGKYIHLGYHDEINEAAKAYNKAAIKYHGKFALLNEIKKESSETS